MHTRSRTHQNTVQQCSKVRKSCASVAAQPVAVRLDELPAEVCGEKLMSCSMSAQHVRCSGTGCKLRDQWFASCRSCRQLLSNFFCSPAQPRQRPLLCRQCAGACAALCSPSGTSACRAALKASMRQAVQGGAHTTTLDFNTRGPRHQFVASAGAAWCAPFLASLSVVSP